MYMNASGDKKYQNKHRGVNWTESINSRRQAMAPSDSDSSDTKESIPPPETLLPKAPSTTSVRKCSSCACKKSISSIKNQNESCSLLREKENEKKRQLRLQQLEAKLYSAKVEDAANNERLKVAKKKLDRAEALLDAQVMYMESLDWKVRSLDRLIHLAGKFLKKDINQSEAAVGCTLEKIPMSRDAEVIERMMELYHFVKSATVTPELLYQLQGELRGRQKDYKAISTSLSYHLHNTSKVGLDLLKNYENEFDKVRGRYESTRQALDKEYTKLLEERHTIVLNCFSKLLPLQEKLMVEDKEFLNLSKEMSKFLLEPTAKTSQNQLCDDDEKYYKQRRKYS